MINSTLYKYTLIFCFCLLFVINALSQKYITVGDGMVWPGIGLERYMDMDIQTGNVRDLCAVATFPFEMDIALDPSGDTMYGIGEYIFCRSYQSCSFDSIVDIDTLIPTASITNHYTTHIVNLTIDAEGLLYFISLGSTTPPYDQRIVQFDPGSLEVQYIDTIDFPYIYPGDLTFLDGMLVFNMHDGISPVQNLMLVHYDIDNRSYTTTSWDDSDASIVFPGMASDGDPCSTDTIYVRSDSLYRLDIEAGQRIAIHPRPSGFNGVSATTTTEYLASIPPLALDSVTVDSASCRQDDGVITLHHRYMRGRGMSYILSDGQVSRIPRFDELPPGAYTVELYDTIYGCSYISDTIIVDASTALTSPSITVMPAYCEMDNGQITLTGLSPGTAIGLLGDALAGDSSFTDLAPGSYDIVLSLDACEDTITVFVDEIAAPSFSLDVDHDRCGQGIGRISITELAPDGVMTSLDGLTYSTDTAYLGLTSGMYHVYVRDSFGCVVSDSIMIDDLEGPAIDSIALASSSCDQATGVIQVSATGINLTYRLDAQPWQNDPLWTDVAAGAYMIYTQDDAGCSDSASVVVTAADGPVISDYDVLPWNCDDAPGSIVVHMDDLGDFRFSADGMTWQPDSIFSDLQPGAYEILVEDMATGCISAIDIAVSANTPIQWSAIELTLASCEDEHISQLSATCEGGTRPYQFFIDDEPISLPYAHLPSGSLTLAVTDQAGCLLDTLLVIPADQRPRNISTAILPPDCGEEVGELSISGELPTALLVDGMSMTADDLLELAPGRYTLSIPSDTNYCAWTADINMPSPACNYYIPSAFSPNNDGINDRLYLMGQDTEATYTLSVFNRWGGVVYHRDHLTVNDGASAWDGTSDGQLLDPGSYFFMYTLTETDGTVRHAEGVIVLMR